MSRPAHSKGPWQRQHGVISDKHGYYSTRDVRAGDIVCRMDGSTMMAFERDANARLIEKAPELRRIVVNLAGGKVMWTPGDMQGIIELLRYIDKG